MNKFTPGPWSNPKNHKGVYGGRNREMIADCGVSALSSEIKEANARLIAMAPEMLEALKTMTMLVTLKYGNLDKDVWEKIAEAQALIAKVE